ncbi:uncharacterized protein involved in exopolysaccharide biosynthesis [Sinobacterium caligoides]|uniref:Uncharacterized protein involved in exopolysaccharide biosynthesis n=1 Tax=Sinobacterium caligoides TaxID=933926 RepID=A0A3N2DNX0_9GAMM|nr:hypothetical protein [Sinobacterium caligoides]ROS01508.1 uncharacterized protein involved in exopolysaccharide biosynthesis [Sinobacterium caligoides]
MSNDDEDDKGFDFDPRTLWLEIRFKLLIALMVAAFVTVLLNYFILKDALPKYSAMAVIIRHQKNMGYTQNIPYLYLQLDASTVIETFLVEQNVRRIADRLGEQYSAEALIGKIKVENVGRSAIINVKAKWHTAQGAADIANAISEIFLESYRKIQNASAEKIRHYYQQELIIAKTNLSKLNQNIDKFKKKNNIYSYKNKVASLYEKRTELEIKLVKLKLTKTEMEENTKGIALKLQGLPEIVVISTLNRSNDEELMASLRDELDTIQHRYTRENPKVQNLLKKIELFEQQLQQRKETKNDNKKASIQHTTGKNDLYLELEVQQIRYQLALEAVLLQTEQLTNEIDSINYELNKISSLTEQYDNLVILVESAKRHVISMDTRLTEAKIAIEANTSDYDILERAKPSAETDLSLRSFLGLTGGIVFALGGCVIIVLREARNSTVKTNFELNRHLAVESFGTLPDKSTVDITTFYSHFQLISEAIQQRLDSTENHLNLIASLSGGEGKSFVINELAEAYSRQQKKILIIETLYEQNTQEEQYSINKALYSLDRQQKLHFINLSSQADKGYFHFDQAVFLDTLDHERIAFFIKKMNQHYDMILWECFIPTNHLQLFSSLCRHAGVITLIAKSRSTERDDINRLYNHLQANDAPQLGVIVNHVKKDYL